MNDLDEKFESVAWPELGDKLFKVSPDDQHNASLNMGGKGWESYAYGYKKAADMLAMRFLEDCKGADIVGYPILFLYRHYIELRLKALIKSEAVCC
jgi:hypothetical protein